MQSGSPCPPPKTCNSLQRVRNEQVISPNNRIPQEGWGVVTTFLPHIPLNELSSPHCGRLNSPAGDGDFYFGGGDVAGDRVEVVHRRHVI